MVPCQLNKCDMRESRMQMHKELWGLTHLLPNPGFANYQLSDLGKVA